MGILDSKARILDTIVTLEGRRQIALGKLRIEYVSFTDAAAYYAADVVSGSADATERIYLESCHLPQDQIAFEADDSGLLKPFKNESSIQVKNGKIITYSFDNSVQSLLSGSNENVVFLKNQEFVSTAENLLESSVDNFSKLRVIGTDDNFFEDNDFLLNVSNIEYTLTKEKPIEDPMNYVANVNHLESLFSDIKLSRVINYNFLPPINRLDDESVDKTDFRNTSNQRLSGYSPWGRTHVDGLNGSQIENDLLFYEQNGFCKTVTFDQVSQNNRIMLQVFEIGNSSIKKLDVIDYGRYQWNDSQRHLFFVGKVVRDQNDTDTFIHIFTLSFGQ